MSPLVCMALQVTWQLAIKVWGSEMPGEVNPTVLASTAVSRRGHTHLLPGQRIVLPNVKNAGIEKWSPVSPLRYIVVFSWQNKKVEPKKLRVSSSFPWPPTGSLHFPSKTFFLYSSSQDTSWADTSEDTSTRMYPYSNISSPLLSFNLFLLLLLLYLFVVIFVCLFVYAYTLHHSPHIDIRE